MEKALLEAAADALSIHAVYLRSSEVRCKDDFIPQFIKDELSLVPQYRVGPTGTLHLVKATAPESGDQSTSVLFYFAAGVRLLDGASLNGEEDEQDISDDAVYIEVTSEFCAHYGLNGAADEEALRPALQEFGRYNVGYHVWPYWREYVQNVCARIGIPPLPVPMFRLSEMAPETEPGKE